MVIHRNSGYFVKKDTESNTKYTEVQSVRMPDFLINNILSVECGGQIFKQTVGIPMGTNCAPLFADVFSHFYEAEFIQNILKSGEKKLRIPQNPGTLLHISSYSLNLTITLIYALGCMTKEMTLIVLP